MKKIKIKKKAKKRGNPPKYNGVVGEFRKRFNKGSIMEKVLIVIMLIRLMVAILIILNMKTLMLIALRLMLKVFQSIQDQQKIKWLIPFYLLRNLMIYYLIMNYL